MMCRMISSLYLDKFNVLVILRTACLEYPPILTQIYSCPGSIIDDALNVLLRPSPIPSILSLFVFLLSVLLLRPCGQLAVIYSV